MNKWTKPLLIGLGITVLYYGLAWFIKGAKKPSTYHGHYEIQLKPKKLELTSAVKDKVINTMEQRIAALGYKYELRSVNDHLLDLTISNIADTIEITRLITGNSSLEFREMYTIQ